MTSFAVRVSVRQAVALSVALVVGWLLAPGVGKANGRFPEANQLIVDPAEPRHLVVRTTFGIVRSYDGGSTWTWTCEDAISALGLLDEEILVTTQGRTSVALSDGIATTTREGCAWEKVTGDLVGQHVMDLVGDPGRRDSAYAAVTITIGGSAHGRIAHTADGGSSWSFIGDILQSTVPLTIEIAASRPQRLYLGVNDGNFEFGYIDVSDDGGLTWTRHEPPRGVDSVYISAVDPMNADRLYVRSTFPEQALYVSEDGAATWKVIHTGLKPLTGFALSPDGRAIAVGGEEGITILDRADAGDGTSTFTSTPAALLNAKCLTWTAAGLFTCADDTTDGFSVALSLNRGQTFKPLLRLPDLVPAWCPADTSVARTCPAVWCGFADVIGARCAPAVKPSPPTSGCSCQASGTGATTPGWALVVCQLFALVGLIRRARGRRALQGLPVAIAPPRTGGQFSRP